LWTPGPTVLVKNESGAAIQQYGVLGLGSPIALPFAGQTCFRGAAPTGENPHFVVLFEPLEDDAIGRGVSKKLACNHLND